MECPAANISLPSTHYHLEKRSLADETAQSGGHIDSLRNGDMDARYRRNILKTWINDHVLDWYMGLILDGVKTYLNLSESLPDKSQLLIYSSPVIDDFDPEVKVFKIHKGHKNIVLKVGKTLISLIK